MAEETLLSASRRVVREFNIIMNGHGGLVSTEFEAAMNTLDLQVHLAQSAEAQAQKEALSNADPRPTPVRDVHKDAPPGGQRSR